jgi:hypothetical protein
MKKYLLIFFLSLSLLACSNSKVIDQKCKSHKCSVSLKNINFSYHNLNNGRLEFDLAANTTGWVAIGFGAQHKMAGATIIIAYVDKNGKVVSSYDYGVSSGSHKPISSLMNQPSGYYDEVKSLSGYVHDGWTHISFTLPVTSKNIKYGYDFSKVKDQKLKVILAYGSNNQKNLSIHHTYATSYQIDKLKI